MSALYTVLLSFVSDDGIRSEYVRPAGSPNSPDQATAFQSREDADRAVDRRVMAMDQAEKATFLGAHVREARVGGWRRFRPR